MRIFRRRQELVVLAPAKVNLFLEVHGKRPDGFHEIATLIVALRFHDVLGFTANDSRDVVLETNRPDLSAGPDNLVIRAARLLQDKTGSTRGARIRLIKRIPLMAGLAGGSADAAATLLALNRLWELDRPPQELAQWSADIGSDLPFFFSLPAAWCTGRGERVEPVPLTRPLDLVLLCPPFGCSTADVYRNARVPEAPLSGMPVREALEHGDRTRLGSLLFNRLGPAAQAVAPRLGPLLQELQAQAPLGQLMSGSGSTLFALCRDRAEARRLARSLRRQPGLKECKIFAVRTQAVSGAVAVPSHPA